MRKQAGISPDEFPAFWQTTGVFVVPDLVASTCRSVKGTANQQSPIASRGCVLADLNLVKRLCRPYGACSSGAADPGFRTKERYFIRGYSLPCLRHFLCGEIPSFFQQIMRFYFARYLRYFFVA
jgi:hypothetical protein